MQYSLWTLQFWGIEAQIPFTRLITTVQKRPGVPLPGSSVDKHSCNRKGWKPLKHLEAVGSVAGLGSSFLWVPVPQLSYRARNYLYLHLSDQLSHHEKRRFFDMEPIKGILIYSVDAMICESLAYLGSIWVTTETHPTTWETAWLLLSVHQPLFVCLRENNNAAELPPQMQALKNRPLQSSVLKHRMQLLSLLLKFPISWFSLAWSSQ